MKFFKGTISNCKKEVLSHTSGNVKVSTGIYGNVYGGGAKQKPNTNTTLILS